MASGGEGGWLTDALDGVPDPAQAGVDGVGEGAQGAAGIAVLDVGQRHVEGDEQGAQVAEIVGDVEERDLRFVRQSRRCGGRSCGRCAAIGLEQRLHLRDLGGRATGEYAREPGGVCRGQAVVFFWVRRRGVAGKGVHASPLSPAGTVTLA